MALEAELAKEKLLSSSARGGVAREKQHDSAVSKSKSPASLPQGASHASGRHRRVVVARDAAPAMAPAPCEASAAAESEGRAPPVTMNAAAETGARKHIYIKCDCLTLSRAHLPLQPLPAPLYMWSYRTWISVV
eukprot:7958302-Pyramimonas_sp.AAC.3